MTARPTEGIVAAAIRSLGRTLARLSPEQARAIAQGILDEVVRRRAVEPTRHAGRASGSDAGRNTADSPSSPFPEPVRPAPSFSPGDFDDGDSLPKVDPTFRPCCGGVPGIAAVPPLWESPHRSSCEKGKIEEQENRDPPTELGLLRAYMRVHGLRDTSDLAADVWNGPDCRIDELEDGDVVAIWDRIRANDPDADRVAGEELEQLAPGDAVSLPPVACRLLGPAKNLRALRSAAPRGLLRFEQRGRELSIAIRLDDGRSVRIPLDDAEGFRQLVDAAVSKRDEPRGRRSSSSGRRPKRGA